MYDKPKILIVDDRESNLVSLRKVLEGLDAEVFSAQSGDEALALTITHEFALAILDVQMPGMDGFELAAFLRGEPSTSEIPIIFVSAVFTEDAHVFRGYESGAVDFLPKPIQREWLLGKARVFLDLYEQKMRYKRRLKVSEAVEGALVLVSHQLNKTRTPDLHAGVTKCLEILGRYTLSDRVYLSVCAPKAEQRYQEEWCADHRAPGCIALRHPALTSLPWLAEQLSQNRTVFIPRVAELPPEASAERNVMSAAAVTSTIFVPVAESDCPGGVLILEWLERPTPLMEFVVSLIQVAGNMLFGALNRLWSESALRDSEARQQLALQGADLGTWDWDARTDQVTYSPRWAEILGFSQEELEPVLRTWESRIHPDDIEDTLTALQEHMEGRSPFYESEYRLLSRTGEWIWVFDRGKVMERDAVGMALRACGTLMDISRHKQVEQERLQVEMQLQQAQKMESIGQLAGGVAHDFNNHLSIILGTAELLSLEGEISPAQRERIDLIVNVSIRASRLTKQLLLFSRKQAVIPRPMDCNEQIGASVKLYRRLIGEDISLHFEGGRDLPLIFADEQQVDQVIANLLINARDAIHDKSNANPARAITIRSAIAHELPAASEFHDKQPSSYIRIDVSDNGVGMTSEVQRRIFEPFFTTKPAGHGTGLGLSTVFGIMKQNSGYIEVQSNPGEGTRFSTYWPCLEVGGGPMFDDTNTEPGMKTGEGHELILFVEDDTELRRISVQFLRGKGYRVIESQSGDDAMQLLADGNFRPDLLIADVVMPGMNGIELVSGAKRLIPDIRALLISGYTDDILSRFLSDKHEFQLLEKPYGVEVLLKRVALLLADNAPHHENLCLGSVG